jgi:hypothetical protein
LNYEESQHRLSGFLDWLESNEETFAILTQLENRKHAEELLEKAEWRKSPQASSLEEIVYVGLYLLREVKAGKDLWGISMGYGIHPSYNTSRLQDMADEVMERYIDPAIDQIENELEKKVQKQIPQYYPPVILSGDFRGSNLSINSTLTESSQIIKSISDGNEAIKSELIELLDELQGLLSQVSADRAEDAKTVAWAAEELIKARTSEKPNASRIEITKEGLKKAATNISSVMPTVLVVAGKIIEAITRVK